MPITAAATTASGAFAADTPLQVPGVTAIAADRTSTSVDFQRQRPSRHIQPLRR
jgi:hypothetical protein